MKHIHTYDEAVNEGLITNVLGGLIRGIIKLIKKLLFALNKKKKQAAADDDSKLVAQYDNIINKYQDQLATYDDNATAKKKSAMTKETLRRKTFKLKKLINSYRS